MGVIQMKRLYLYTIALVSDIGTVKWCFPVYELCSALT